MRAATFNLCGLLATLLLPCAGASADPQDDLSGPVLEQQAPVPSTATEAGRVSVRKVVLTGSGCSEWTGEVYQNENQLRLLFPDYRFAFDMWRMRQSIDCVVSIDLNIPEGRTVAVAKLKFEGVTRVDRNAYLDFSAGVAWQGQSTKIPATKVRRASSFEGKVELDDDIAGRAPTLDFRPCDGEKRALEVHLSAALDRMADASAGLSALHSHEVALVLDVESCPDADGVLAR